MVLQWKHKIQKQNFSLFFSRFFFHSLHALYSDGSTREKMGATLLPVYEEWKRERDREAEREKERKREREREKHKGRKQSLVMLTRWSAFSPRVSFACTFTQKVLPWSANFFPPCLSYSRIPTLHQYFVLHFFFCVYPQQCLSARMMRSRFPECPACLHGAPFSLSSSGFYLEPSSFPPPV